MILEPATLDPWLGLVIALLTINALVIAGIAALWRMIAEPRIEKLIRARTEQIQPNTNGGKSLADAHDTLNRIESTVRTVHRRVDDHLEWHAERDQTRRDRSTD